MKPGFLLELHEGETLNTLDARSAYNDLEEAKVTLEKKENIPSNKLLIPFYYLRLIGNSIRQGEIIVNNMHVPKAVWTQNSIKILFLSKKNQTFRLLSDALQRYSNNMIKNTITLNVF